MTTEQQILLDIARDHARLLAAQLHGVVNVPLALNHCTEARRALELLQLTDGAPRRTRPTENVIEVTSTKQP